MPWAFCILSRTFGQKQKTTHAWISRALNIEQNVHREQELGQKEHITSGSDRMSCFVVFICCLLVLIGCHVNFITIIIGH